MEYQEFLEYVERFFAKAGAVLRKKGRDYPALEGAPSYILVDQGRHNYYLLEIAAGPVVPVESAVLHHAIEEYATKEGIGSHICGLFIALGSWFKHPNLSLATDALQLDGLEQLSCLVVAKEMRNDIEDYMEQLGLEFQVIPFDILCIYFLSQESSEKVAELYDSLELALPQEAELSEDEAEKELETEFKPEIGESEAEPKEYEALASQSTMVEQLEEVLSDGGAEEIKTSVFRERYKQYQAENEKEDSEAFGKDELREIARIKESIEKEEKYYRARDTERELGNTESKFYNICNQLWAFIVYTPLSIVSFFAKGRLAPSVMLSVSCIFLVFGLLYYPLSFLLNLLNDVLLHKINANMEYLLIFFSSWDRADVFARIVATDGFEPYLRNLSSFTMSIFYFNTGLVNFLSTEYYLRYLCSLGYLLAIVPIWRGFGLRMVAFFISFLIFYIPMLMVGSVAMRLIVIYADSGIANAQTDSSAALAVLNASFVSTAVVALAVPLLSAFLAAKVSKWKPRTFKHG